MRNPFNILGFEGQAEVFSAWIILRASVSPAKRVVNLDDMSFECQWIKLIRPHPRDPRFKFLHVFQRPLVIRVGFC